MPLWAPCGTGGEVAAGLGAAGVSAGQITAGASHAGTCWVYDAAIDQGVSAIYDK